MVTALTTPESRTLFPSRLRMPFAAIEESMQDLWSRFQGDGWPWFAGMHPNLDLVETDSKLEIKLDVPGIHREDLEIQLNANTLTITGKRDEKREEKEKNYHRIERHMGSFSRTVTLPCSVQEDKVEAEYHHGVLTVTLPKTEEAKTKRIKIKS